jgi:hypothetical protein
MRDTVTAPHTPLRLIGTPFETVTDSAGAFVFTGLLPGRYTFAVPDSTLNAIGMELTRGDGFASDRDDVRLGDVQLPTAEAYVRFRCPDTREGSLRLVVGRVHLPDGETAGRAEIRVKRGKSAAAGQGVRNVVLGRGRIAGAADTMHVSYETIHRDKTAPSTMFYLAHDGVIGAGGTFFVCELDPLGLFRIEATDGDLTGRTTFVMPAALPSILSVRIDLAPSR